MRSAIDFIIHDMSTVPRLFGPVSIGINRYKEIRPKLSGAVTDANTIIEHLSSKTSASPILSLKDKQATRKADIKAFKTLDESKNIGKKNDPIVIYFAGHGVEAQKQGQEERRK